MKVFTKKSRNLSWIGAVKFTFPNPPQKKVSDGQRDGHLEL